MIYKRNACQSLHVEPVFLSSISAIDKLKQQKISIPVMLLASAIDVRNKNKLTEVAPLAQQVFVAEVSYVSNLENVAGFNLTIREFLNSIN